MRVQWRESIVVGVVVERRQQRRRRICKPIVLLHDYRVRIVLLKGVFCIKNDNVSRMHLE